MFAVALAGCGGNVTVTRGFDSREVLPLRDPNHEIGIYSVTDVQGSDPTIGYTTHEDDGGVTYWSLDLQTGARQMVSGPQPTTSSGTTMSSGGRFTCVAKGLTGGTTSLQITDTTTGVVTTVDGVVASFNGCPNDDGSLAIFRVDPNGSDLVLWSGPYQQLATIELPIEVRTIVRFASTTAGVPDGGAPVAASVTVAATAPGDPAVGIYSIDLGSDAVTNVVPAALSSGAWAAGAPQAGSLQSSTISLDLAISRFNGHYLYGRKMSDGGTTMFAGPLASGAATELALFQISAAGIPSLGTGLRVSGPDNSIVPAAIPAMASWELDGPGGAAPNQLMVWDDTDAEVYVCPSAEGALQAGVLSPDGSRVLFSQADGTYITSVGPLQLLTLGAGGSDSCVQLSSNAWWADYSFDGSKIAWIDETDSVQDGQLWIAGGDGSGAQMIFAGALYGARFMYASSKLELSYGGDLVWLDTQNPSAGLVHVAEQLFGSATFVGGSWFVGGYDYSTQDSSGLLGAINLDNGKKIQISPSVTEYVVVAQTAPSDDDSLSSPGTPTGVYHVVYLVRGRNPSPQDGFWVATIQAADLQ